MSNINDIFNDFLLSVLNENNAGLLKELSLKWKQYLSQPVIEPKQQPPQEEQNTKRMSFQRVSGGDTFKIKEEFYEHNPQKEEQPPVKEGGFVWTDEAVVEFISVFWTLCNGRYVPDKINEFKAFKSTPKEEKIEFKNWGMLMPKTGIKMYTEEQLREAFEAGRKGKSTTWEANGSGNQTGVNGFTYPNFDSYLQSLNKQ